MKLPPPLFALGQTVYLRVNPDYIGMITGFLYRPGSVLLYLVTWGEDGDEKQHWGCELTEEKTFKVENENNT